MDQGLRELRRQALLGDPTAALQYFYALKRSELQSKPASVGPTIVQIQYSRLRGSVEITPLSGTQIYFISPSEPNTYGGRSQMPTTIYNVDYYLRCSYYYYPELGWTPHSPEQVAHAQEHYSQHIKEMKQQEWSGPGTWPDERTLQWYLQRPGVESPCFSCGSFAGSHTFHATRINRHEDMGISAIQLLNPALTQLALEFSEQYPDLMLQAELQSLSDEIESLDSDIEKERATIITMEQRLAGLVIREIQAQDRVHRQNPDPWEDFAARAGDPWKDSDILAWFEYLKLSDEGTREAELGSMLREAHPDVAAFWINRLMQVILAQVEGAQAQLLAEQIMKRVIETPDHLQTKVLKDFLLIIFQVMSEGDTD